MRTYTHNFTYKRPVDETLFVTTNPAICGLNNGCETGVKRNPNGSPKLVSLGLTTANTAYESTTLTYGVKVQNTDGSRNFTI